MYTRSLLFLVLIFNLSCVKDEDNYTFYSNEKNGITFINKINNSASINILNYLYFYNGAGVAIADFNNDGLDDLYFSSNLHADHLYMNEGNLNFKEVTSLSKIKNDFGWTTGVTIVDINNDGLMDIYVSKVNEHLELQGHNLLFVHQGIDDGIPIFKEESKKYGLNFSGLSTQASFFDYDLDGDLDMYLLNHSVHPNSNYGKGRLRTSYSSTSGDKLYRNDNGFYYDVTGSSGIYQSKLGYGLGVSVGDINNDGYPDIYIGNDFFENDYVYINMQDGTFKELNTSESILGHSSHFTMGTDIADINNDGHQDIITLDMLPEELESLKSSGTEYPYPIYKQRLKNGYEPQFMQNTLHINNGNATFSETAFASNIAATEWSWSPLISDFDNDGLKDIYITNGILGATNNMDFVNFIANEKIQKKLGAGILNEDLYIIDEIPQKEIYNYHFKNKGDGTFQNMSSDIRNVTKTFSNGASYADLDNDGDLEIVLNNTNSLASVLENKTRDLKKTNFLKINFLGNPKNINGIGAKITCYTRDKEQHFENFTTRGYLSAVPPKTFIGLDTITKVDSLTITWPTGEVQTYYDVPANQTFNVEFAKSLKNNAITKDKPSRVLLTVPPLLDVEQEENISLDFNRIPLSPYSQSKQSRIIEVADVDQDGMDDIITLGAKGSFTKLHFQSNKPDYPSFKMELLSDSLKTKIYEDTDVTIFDANGDNKNDILIVSGGNEFLSGKAIQPRLYIGKENGFQRDTVAFKAVEINASSVTSVDIDNDGDLDICITSDTVPQTYGVTPDQMIFENDGLGNFKDITDTFALVLKSIGNVRDITWHDIDGNGYKDAIVVGHWMPVTILLNDGLSLTKLSNSTLAQSNGWWNTIVTDDFDNDGDIDIIAGNWGLNSKLRASISQPMKLYLNDFDNNNMLDPIITYIENNQETTLASKDEMVKQLPFINKKFLSYNAFAKASVNEILGNDAMKRVQTKIVHTLATTYFENKGHGEFTARKLPFRAQLSPIYDIKAEDFNNDGYKDIIIVGNEFEISTQLGRLDASHGTIFINDKNGFFYENINQLFNISGFSRSVKSFSSCQSDYLIIGKSNDTLQFLKKLYD